jgi:hypothetical protein
MRRTRRKSEIPAAAFGVEARGSGKGLQKRGFAGAVLTHQEGHRLIEGDLIERAYRRNAERERSKILNAGAEKLCRYEEISGIIDRHCGREIGKEAGMFFSEEKNQKTFASAPATQ